jgi:hypothetical protein
MAAAMAAGLIKEVVTNVLVPALAGTQATEGSHQVIILAGMGYSQPAVAAVAGALLTGEIRMAAVALGFLD